MDGMRFRKIIAQGRQKRKGQGNEFSRGKPSRGDGLRFEFDEDGDHAVRRIAWAGVREGNRQIRVSQGCQVDRDS